LHYFKRGWLLGWPIVVSLGAALLSAMLVLGWERGFAGCLAIALWLTSYDFNPVSIGFPDFRSSELGRAIQRITARDEGSGGRKSLWLTYGGIKYPNGGTIAQVMGARALAGVYYHPQFDVWAPLDPKGAEQFKYNRFAVTRLALPQLSSDKAVFKLLAFSVLLVEVSPLHPALRQLGARYVLTFGAQPAFAAAKFTELYRSKTQDFTIWELPAAQP